MLLSAFVAVVVHVPCILHLALGQVEIKFQEWCYQSIGKTNSVNKGHAQSTFQELKHMQLGAAYQTFSLGVIFEVLKSFKTINSQLKDELRK